MKLQIKTVIAASCLLAAISCSRQIPTPVVLPTPQSMELHGGSRRALYITDVKLVQNQEIPKEGYELEINKKGITISYSDESGKIYGYRTLYLIERQCGSRLPCMTIKDAPKFPFRSFMLDSGRQYQKPKTIMRWLNILAFLKINTFHWHLTEGLGWRMEIKAFPELTTKGAFVANGPEQQGFYTQREIKEIVQYANTLGITIIPEIDIPGHSEAALTAYPQFACFPDSVRVPEVGYTANIFCAGNDKTIEFLKKVMDEVCEVFPSEYIHLGGDEAPKTMWDACPKCQRRIKKLGLKDSHQLQQWLSTEMANYLATKGKKVIFWGDVVCKEGPKLPENVVIHWWNYMGHKDLEYINATKQGLPVICGTNYYTYLNYPITPWKGYGKGRMFDIRDAYDNNKCNLENPTGNIIGMSTALWTDHGVTESQMDIRVFPRIFALTQQMWYGGEKIPFETFYQDVKRVQPAFESLGCKFGPGLREEVVEGFEW